MREKIGSLRKVNSHKTCKSIGISLKSKMPTSEMPALLQRATVLRTPWRKRVEHCTCKPDHLAPKNQINETCQNLCYCKNLSVLFPIHSALRSRLANLWFKTSQDTFCTVDHLLHPGSFQPPQCWRSQTSPWREAVYIMKWPKKET